MGAGTQIETAIAELFRARVEQLAAIGRVQLARSGVHHFRIVFRRQPAIPTPAASLTGIG
jgi:hypothetical protein